ncbi:hypothetical protein ABLE91_08220 [Aquabacter sp. CN5-332]|uniref:hypothetical protein n=1 Tax=Aquabacter sp. CN5-332 TaxID=3156608 RepID=UPI0032B349F4
MSDRTKQIVAFLCLLPFVGFSACQLWWAAVDGSVWSGSKRHYQWYSRQEAPEWFWGGVTFHGVVLAVFLCGVGLLIYMRREARDQESRWRTRPPMEEDRFRQVMSPPAPSRPSKPE